jgi:Barrel-sandwich domain of CusB or HlyD membrane-fusion/GAF domain
MSAVTSGARQSGTDSDSWSAFASASSREGFCAAWLGLQCSIIVDVRAGLLLLREDNAQAFVPAAAWPDSSHDLRYLAAAAEKALGERRGVVVGLDDRGQAVSGSVHVALPIALDDQLMGAVVLDVLARPEPLLQAVLRQLFWGAGWLEALLRRQRLQRDSGLLDRAAIGLDLVQAAQEQDSLERAAIAVVNELATRMKADRVSLGIARLHKLELRAMSRTAWFDRKTQLVETIENAMEEAIDQEAGVAFPPLLQARGKIVVAQRDLASRARAATVLSVPLVSRGRPIGALTLERNQGPAFDAAALELCALLGELLGPALDSKREGERWLRGRAVDKLAQWRDELRDPRRPSLKLAAVLALAAALFLGFAEGKFRVTAKTLVEGAVQRAAVAPFQGYVAEALVRAGDTVRSGQLLAVLDDRDLRLERIRWRSEREQVHGKYSEALAKHDRSASRILAAQLGQADAQLALTEEKLARTQLVAPFDGVVVAGDLSQMLGAPVEQGKVLFELAPLDAYRVILQVDERDISYVAVGQRGELALSGMSTSAVPFTVKAVTSVATAQEGRNFFRVEAELQAAPAGIRPGMEGVGKISAGERGLLWIWTRNFVNWVRISFWAWMP